MQGASVSPKRPDSQHAGAHLLALSRDRPEVRGWCLRRGWLGYTPLQLQPGLVVRVRPENEQQHELKLDFMDLVRDSSTKSRQTDALSF